jgi:uncharacterized protein with HEPN domain
MTPRDDRVYLQHIVDAANAVDGYLRGVDEAKFQATGLLQDGVRACYEITA